MTRVLEERRWSTTHAARGTAADYWQEAHLDAFFEMEVAVERTEDFRASIVQTPAGPISLSRLELNSRQHLSRSRRSIARCNRHHFEFIVMLEGQTLLRQQGREQVLTAGESVLVDNRVPYELQTSDSSKNLVFHMPIPWLDLWAPSSTDICARVIREDTPWAKVVNAMTVSISEMQGSDDFGRLQLYAEQLTSAISLALAETENPVAGTGADPIFLRAREALRSCAHDPEFNVHMLAGQLNISVRYLHKIFAAHGTTFSAELFAMRLDRAGQMLRDARFAKLPIGEIGWRAGFADQSHFSRRFRDHFGVPPGKYRLERLPQ